MTDADKQHHTASREQAEITLRGDVRRVLGASQRRQSMRGYDEQFTDIVDYIIRITHEIWDEKAVGKLYDYYQTNAVIHTSTGDIFGREAILQGTLQTLGGYPDRRLHGEEVIWSGDDERGFYTSHRIRHEATNTGHTPYGAPTGRKIGYRAIADCASRENMIYEEWLVRDEIVLLRQLGLDVHKLARRMAQVDAENGFQVELNGEPERLRGQLPPPELPADDDPEALVRAMFQNVWNRRMLNQVETYFAPTFTGESASGRRMNGRGEYQTYMLALLAPFSDMAIHVEHTCAVGSAADGYRVATRWWMTGRHVGPGIYGEPTGKPVKVLGITHHLVRGGQIAREWTVFDEFALLKQLCAPA